MPKVILFDIDNTLLSFDEFVKETMKNGFEKFEIGIYEDKMFGVFNQVNTVLWQKIENGEMNLEELEKVRWNMIFDCLGMNADGETFERYFRDYLFESAITVDGALDLLEYLHGKYILCVASNGPYLQQVNRLKLSGMLTYFSDLFISEEIGSSKPSERFFDVCIDRLCFNLKQKIRPHEIMIIGDSLSSDMVGGKRFGMQTCFYNPGKKSIEDEMNPDYQVASLSEIKSIL